MSKIIVYDGLDNIIGGIETLVQRPEENFNRTDISLFLPKINKILPLEGEYNGEKTTQIYFPLLMGFVYLSEKGRLRVEPFSFSGINTKSELNFKDIDKLPEKLVNEQISQIKVEFEPRSDETCLRLHFGYGERLSNNEEHLPLWLGLRKYDLPSPLSLYLASAEILLEKNDSGEYTIDKTVIEYFKHLFIDSFEVSGEKTLYRKKTELFEKGFSKEEIDYRQCIEEIKGEELARFVKLDLLLHYIKKLEEIRDKNKDRGVVDSGLVGVEIRHINIGIPRKDYSDNYPEYDINTDGKVVLGSPLSKLYNNEGLDIAIKSLRAEHQQLADKGYGRLMEHIGGSPK